jgi:hypothetical protein
MERFASLWMEAHSSVEETVEVQRGTKYILCVMEYIVPRWVVMCFWVTAIVLQTGLATMMIHRSLARRFPAFFAYTVYEALLSAFLFTIGHMDSVTREQYGNALLAGAAGSAALRFAVVCEIFIQVFRGYPRLKELGEVIFRWATVILMLVAVLIVANLTGLEGTGLEKDWYAVGFQVVDRAVNIIQCGLLVFLVLLASFLRFSWTSHIMGIALGFGVFSSVELCLSALKAQYGMYFAWRAIPVIQSVTYLGCLGIWNVTLLLSEFRSRRINPGVVNDLQHWNNELERVLRQ